MIHNWGIPYLSGETNCIKRLTHFNGLFSHLVSAFTLENPFCWKCFRRKTFVVKFFTFASVHLNFRLESQRETPNLISELSASDLIVVTCFVTKLLVPLGPLNQKLLTRLFETFWIDKKMANYAPKDMLQTEDSRCTAYSHTAIKVSLLKCHQYIVTAWTKMPNVSSATSIDYNVSDFLSVSVSFV